MLGSGVSPWHQIHYSKSNRYVGVEDEALLIFFFAQKSSQARMRSTRRHHRYGRRRHTAELLGCRQLEPSKPPSGRQGGQRECRGYTLMFRWQERCVLHR